MYPWKEALTNWADRVQLHIDALGLITILGNEEVDRSIGRLVYNPWLEFLPLLAAFIVASNRFVECPSGFTIYNITSGIQTTEISGWFSRWLKAQDFSHTSDIVHCLVSEPGERKPFLRQLLLMSLPLGILLNGMLVALTVLSGDWWGFCNAIAMIVSVVVRQALLWQHRIAIDWAITESKKFARRDRDRKTRMIHALDMPANKALDRPHAQDHNNDRHESVTPVGAVPQLEATSLGRPRSPEEIGKVIIIMDDAKVVTVKAPEFIIRRILVQNPEVPHPKCYMFFRLLGWAAFAVHIVTLGMAALPTQICSVVLLLSVTILTVFKVGCEDWKIRERVDKKAEKSDNETELSPPCWISSKLCLRCSSYPAEWAKWAALDQFEDDNFVILGHQASERLDGETPNGEHIREEDKDVDDEEKSIPVGNIIQPPATMSPHVLSRLDGFKRREKHISKARRQDLYVWLQPTPLEETMMGDWGLLPRNDPYWMEEFRMKKEEHASRQRMALGGNPSDLESTHR